MSFERNLFMAEDCDPASSTHDSQYCNAYLEWDNIRKVIYNQLTKLKNSDFGTLSSKLHLIDWGKKSNQSFFICFTTKVVSLTNCEFLIQTIHRKI